MNRYRFKATNMAGKTVTGVLYAKDEDDLREIVRNLNYYLISFSKVTESPQIFGFLEKISVDDICIFCRLLAIMVKTGMQLVESLDIISNTTKNKKLKDVLFYCHNNVLKGKSLSECLEKYPKTFPAFFRNMLHIGELTGKMDVVLESLADYYEREMKTKKTIKSAASYPLMIVAIALAAILVVSFWIMPTFEDVFSQFDADLPALSQGMIDFSHWMKNNFLYVIIVIFVVYMLRSFLMTKEFYQRFHDTLMLNLPIIGPLQYKIATYRFCLGMTNFLSAGMRVPESLEAMSRMLNNHILEDKMKISVSELNRGQSVSKSLRTSGIFPQLLIEMVTVGENTGSLDEIFVRATAYFEGEMNDAIKKATTGIGPVMLGIVGALVAVMMLAIYEPMLSLMNAIE